MLHGTSVIGGTSPGGGPATAGPIARILNADMQLTTDQELSMLFPSSAFIPRRIIARAITGAFNTACAGGIYDRANKTGAIFVAAAQSYAGLTAPNKYIDLTLTATLATDVMTSGRLYLSLTTGNGAALIASIYLYGDVLA